MGNPEISLTLNNDPDKLSVKLNNSPCDPSTLKIGCADPEPIIRNRCVPDPEINTDDAVTLVVTASDPVITAFPVKGKVALPPGAQLALVAKEAETTLLAQLAVPNVEPLCGPINEPVNEPVLTCVELETVPAGKNTVT